jgi:hypothetical protein
MRSLGGLVLLAGVGVGLFVYLPAPVDRSMSLDHASRFTVRSESGPPAPRIETAASEERLRTFSPKVSLASLAPAQARSVAVASATASSRDPQFDTANGWQAVVSTSGSAMPDSASLMPTNPDTRYKLITDIQQQLKRLGCYYGRIDGSWGVGSKDAMRSFTERVNAELPIDEPDYLLLTLLQSHNGKVCGECPPGLAFTADGRCVPQPTVAQSRPGDGLQQSAKTGETLPWKAASAGTGTPASGRPLFSPVATSVVSSEPLPGRMAIGGPKALPPIDSANADPVIMPTGKTNQPLATAALEGAGAAQPSRSTPSQERRQSSYSRSSGRGDAIRHNLMLSLGGVY